VPIFGTLRRSILNCFNYSRVGPELIPYIKMAKIGPHFEMNSARILLDKRLMCWAPHGLQRDWAGSATTYRPGQSPSLTPNLPEPARGPAAEQSEVFLRSSSRPLCQFLVPKSSIKLGHPRHLTIRPPEPTPLPPSRLSSKIKKRNAELKEAPRHTSNRDMNSPKRTISDPTSQLHRLWDRRTSSRTSD